MITTAMITTATATTNNQLQIVILAREAVGNLIQQHLWEDEVMLKKCMELTRAAARVAGQKQAKNLARDLVVLREVFFTCVEDGVRLSEPLRRFVGEYYSQLCADLEQEAHLFS